MTYYRDMGTFGNPLTGYNGDYYSALIEKQAKAVVYGKVPETIEKGIGNDEINLRKDIKYNSRRKK
jgi:hypothetical protein